MGGGGGRLQPNKDDKACLYIVASWPRRQKERFTDRQAGKLHKNSYDNTSYFNARKVSSPVLHKFLAAEGVVHLFLQCSLVSGGGEGETCRRHKAGLLFCPSSNAGIDPQALCVGPR